MERSVSLLKSLGGEKERWEAGSETFKAQMSTIVGDVLVTSAFMAYAGKVNFILCLLQTKKWCHKTEQLNIKNI